MTQVDGDAASDASPAPFKDHFSSRSADYAARRPTYPLALVDWLAEVSPATSYAWDCGCGSGQLSRQLAVRFAQVVATDASPQQLANAAPDPKVDYRHARAEASGLPDGVADLIVVAQAVHWFDLPAFYAEVRRVARPEAAIALVSYAKAFVHPAVNAALRHIYVDVLDGCWPPERTHVEAGYRDLPFPFPEIPPPDLAVTAEWLVDDMVGYIDTWSAVRNYERIHAASPVSLIRETLQAAWPNGTRQTVRWPLNIRTGRIATD